MITIYKPPVFPQINPYKSIFLAGSIEMGKAIDWQDYFAKEFQKEVKKRENAGLFIGNWDILNPRRDDWDNTWEQSITNPQFYQQVQWELTHLERCQYKVFYFAPNTLSPISLLELGTFHKSKDIYICASDEYLRLGNIQIFAHRYNLQLYSSLDDIITEILKIKL